MKTGEKYTKKEMKSIWDAVNNEIEDLGRRKWKLYTKIEYTYMTIVWNNLTISAAIPAGPYENRAQTSPALLDTVDKCALRQERRPVHGPSVIIGTWDH